MSTPADTDAHASRIRSVVFDIGQVLVRLRPAPLFALLHLGRVHKALAMLEAEAQWFDQR